MDEFLDILTAHDWITPVAAAIEDLKKGGILTLDVWTFFIDYKAGLSSGWPPFTIKMLLAKYNIESWGTLIDGDEFSFNVKLEDARQAESILVIYNVPVLPKSSLVPQSQVKKRVKKSKQQKSFLEKLVAEFLGEVKEALSW